MTEEKIQPPDLTEPRCAHPDRLWGTCGIPASIHEEMFEWAKGGRFFHEFVSPSAAPREGAADGL